jgi:hypothetical protein
VQFRRAIDALQGVLPDGRCQSARGEIHPLELRVNRGHRRVMRAIDGRCIRYDAELRQRCLDLLRIGKQEHATGIEQHELDRLGQP